MNTVVSISERLDTRYPVSQEEAQILYPVLEQAILTESKIELSFKNIENCASIFISGLLGKLYHNYSSLVDRYIRVTNVISDENAIEDRIKRVREKALSRSVVTAG